MSRARCLLCGKLSETVDMYLEICEDCLAEMDEVFPEEDDGQSEFDFEEDD